MDSDPDVDVRQAPTDYEEPPPFLWSWRWVYAAVVIYTCAFILALYWITVAFNS